MKKFLTVFFMFMMAVVVVGCKKTDPYDFDPIFNAVVSKIDVDNVVSNIELPSQVGQVTMTWTSSDTDTISITGTVKRAKEDKEVTLTVVMVYGEETVTKELKVTVPAVPGISSILETVEAGQPAEVSATVVAVSGVSFLLGDGTGYILVYKGANWTADVAVGDVLSISGNLAAYSGTKQFDATATYSKTGTETVAYGTPKALNGAAVDAYNTATSVEIEYVEVTGVISVSGSYYNLAVDGASAVTGSVIAPTDTTHLTTGNEIKVTGYVLYTTSSGRYLNIIPTKIELVKEAAPVDATKATIAEIIAGAVGKYETTGTVVAINARGFLLEDNGSYILVYIGSSWTADVAIGDVLTLTGVTSVYALAKQFGAEITYTKTGTETVNYGTPVALTASAIDALATATAETFAIQYVTVTGTVVVSGNYTNINVEGTTVQLSPAYLADATNFANGNTVEMVGYLTCVTGSSTKYPNIMITSSTVVDGGGEEPVEEATKGTIAEVLAGEVGKYETSGTVVATNARGFLLEDNGSYILVYIGSSWTADVAVGDILTVTGTTSVFGLATQFGGDATYTKTGTETVEPGTPVALTAAAIDALAAATAETFVIQYVTVTGTVVVSGNHTNINVEGTTVQLSPSYPADRTNLADGNKVELVGYLIYVSGSTTKYPNIMITSSTVVTD